MLDIRFIRSNPEIVKDGCRKKGASVDIDRLLEVDERRRQTLQALEDMHAQKNKASKEIAAAKEEKEPAFAKASARQRKEKIILEMRELDRNSDRLNWRLKRQDQEFDNLMHQIPNLPSDEVPAGRDERDNVVLREVAASGESRPAGRGEKPKFDFKPKDYLEIAENLDLIDVKRAAKVSGTRFGYLKKEAALLEFALINLAFDVLIKEGFIPIIPPVILKPEMLGAMGYLKKVRGSRFEVRGSRFEVRGSRFEVRGWEGEEVYFLRDDSLVLVGTSEQSIGVMHADEIFEEKDLPRRYVGFSTCFRREAGAYGKDTKGILRVHQFDKVEMFCLSKPEKSIEEHKFLLSLEEKLMQMLKIPYRVVQMCSGDLGDPFAAKYDIEAWMPGQNQYRETHSTSNGTDFQARRLNIRYRNSQTKKPEFVHTLNGTAFAIGRTLIAIIENYQQKDGTILVPEVLWKYLNLREIK